jgi:hypothetical protein
MSAAIVIALIALAGSILSTVATVFGSPALQARREARRALETYREPLLAACYELQARLYNILRIQFVEKYVVSDKQVRRTPAIQSTLYVFAQFFGWREIIRREVQYLRFSRESHTRDIARLLGDIGETFLADSYGSQFMLWRVEQRGLGERMIQTDQGKSTCLGYASFIEHRATMAEWLDPLEADLERLEDSGRERLTVIQHLLLDLVHRLDETQTRYPFAMKKA